MPRSVVIFKFSQILHRILFVIHVNCNKKRYVQSLSNFKIQFAMHYWKFWRLIVSLFLSLDIFYKDFFCCSSQLQQER